MLEYNYTCDQTNMPLKRLIVSPNVFYAPTTDGDSPFPTEDEQTTINMVQGLSFSSLTAMAHYILENCEGL